MNVLIFKVIRLKNKIIFVRLCFHFEFVVNTTKDEYFNN